MTILLFRLAQVPDDEAADIRALLDEAAIHYYETDAGFWRVGIDGIWLADNSQEQVARALIDQYQTERTQAQRQEYAQLQVEGRAPGLWQKFCENPLRFTGFIVAVVFVAGLTLVPFLLL